MTEPRDGGYPAAPPVPPGPPFADDAYVVWPTVGPRLAALDEARVALAAVSTTSVVHPRGAWWDLASNVLGWLSFAALFVMLAVIPGSDRPLPAAWPWFVAGWLAAAALAAWMDAPRRVRCVPRWSAADGAVLARLLWRLVPPLAPRHPSLMRPPWPAGAEELALLALADRARWIERHWLLECAGMSEDVGDSWLVPMRRAGMVSWPWPGWFGGWAYVRITDRGRERLAQLRADLNSGTAAAT